MRSSFRDWVRWLPQSRGFPSQLSAEQQRERQAEAYHRVQLERERRQVAEEAQEWEAWLSANDLSPDEPMTLEAQRDWARRICDEFEAERMPGLRREIDKLETHAAGGGAERSSARSRAKKLRVELAHMDRLVDELWNVAWPTVVGPAIRGVSWEEYEARKQGHNVDGSPLLDCHRCGKVGAFPSERAKFDAGRRGCKDCAAADREHNEEASRRRNAPTWLDDLKSTLEGGTE